MKTILLTAFGNFPGAVYRCNTTELFAEELGGTTVAGYRIVTATLPCTLPLADQDRGKELVSLAKSVEACGIISTGMSSSADAVLVETRGRNEIRNRRYCDASVLGKPFHPASLPEFDIHLTEWRLRKWREQCKAHDIPTRFSYDAGGYCCESLIVQMYMAQFPPSLHALPFIFLHFPCSPEAVQSFQEHKAAGKILMPLGEMTRAITLLLEHAELP